MIYNYFSSSDDKISLLGFGTWGIGGNIWTGTKETESKAVLRQAIEKGVNIFDSALVYGGGRSERLVGEAEKESGQTLFIATKIPSKKYEWPANDNSTLQQSFPREWIINATERSLKNLNRDYIDLQQFHVWHDNWAQEDEWKEAIELLKRDGKVRYFGLSINDHQPGNGIEAGKTGLIDSFQVIFNIFDQSPIDQLFPYCKENNISIIVRVPFDEGSLTGQIKPETEFPPGDWRNGYFRGDRKKEVWERIQNICMDTETEIQNIPEIALRFIISHDAVTTVIPGMRKKKNLLSNISSIDKGPLPNNMLEILKKHSWERNFYK